MLQLIFSIFRNNSDTSPFNSITEGTLLKCRFQTVHNARNSKDVDALKFQLVRHDTFYNGKTQQDSTECLLMLIDIIHKSSMPGYILPAMYVDWSPPHLSLVVCYIFHLLILLLCKTWFYKDCNRNCKKSCSRCNRNTWQVESSYILHPPKYLLLFVNRFRYINNNVTR